jgi:hypothetical protein
MCSERRSEKLFTLPAYASKSLEPVEAWDADERWLLEVVERGPEHDDKRDKEKEEKPGAALSLRTGEHEVPPFVDEMRSAQHLQRIRKKDR